MSMKKLPLLFLMMTLPLAASADAVEIDGIYYNLVLKAKVAEVMSNPNMYSGVVEIPDTVMYNDVAYDVTSIGGSAFSSCSYLTKITIPNSVTSIGGRAFQCCSGLTSVTIPNSVNSIGEEAFEGCSGLTSVTIPNTVTSIGYGVFWNCSGLTSMTIPNSVKSIGLFAFSDCSGLTSVTISNSVTSISNFAFHGCSGLTSLTIPNSVKSIGWNAFEDCFSLTSVTIPNSVKSIGMYAFQGCRGLTSVTIPNSVTGIGDYAFNNCGGLTSVTIHNSVKSIGNSAFAGCSNLIDVYCYADNVPNTDADAFKDSYVKYVTLHVPESALEKYKTTAPWNGFKGFVALPNYMLTYIVDGEVYKTYKYEEDRKVPVEEAPIKEGYTFSGWSEIPETMPAHDVTVTGTFTKSSLGKCATPTISFKDGEFKFESEDDGVEFVYDVKVGGATAGTGNKVKVTSTYTVSVYATKEGYENSEVATKEIQPTFGDLSGDGKIDAADLTKLIEILLE